MGIRMSRPLGFSNTYAIGMKEETAERLRVRKISDLRDHPGLRLGFSNEFMGRADCWPNLRARYGLPHRDVRGMDHSLAYEALRSGGIEATDLYSTDWQIRAYNLRVLEDDRRAFPDYQAVLLYRAELEERAPEVVQSLLRLEGKIPEKTMIEMNAAAQNNHQPVSQVAADFLGQTLGVQTEAREPTALETLAKRTGQHLTLVGASLLASILVAVPLGVLAARRPRGGQVLLSVVGIIQTIPSLALLMFMIPLLAGLLYLLPALRELKVGGWRVEDTGPAPAVIALFLYSLLPIVRNTYAGLHDIPPHLRESAEALGLPPLARLRLVELPLAARTILAGIKTAAVINVGYATLGALIGAGGYGEAIITGITRSDQSMIIWQGAVPAAVMALAVQGIFELVERYCVPKGLRLKPVN
jgi:osmoprotectant transport system permease protein